MGLLKRLLTTHTITVEPYLGQSGKGKDLFGPVVTVTGWLDESTHMIRDADGDEVVSSATFYTATANAGAFPLGSRVTTATRTARVLTANTNTSGALRLPDHLAVTLT